MEDANDEILLLGSHKNGYIKGGKKKLIYT
jgi:hypothetical protein